MVQVLNVQSFMKAVFSWLFFNKDSFTHAQVKLDLSTSKTSPKLTSSNLIMSI